MFFKHLFPLLALPIACLNLPACAQEPVYVMSRTYEIQGDEVVPTGGGTCSQRGDGPSSSYTSGEGWGESFEEIVKTTDDGVHVIVKSDGVQVADRHYDLDFLLSGEMDRLNAPTARGSVPIDYWGGPECDFAGIRNREPESL